MWAEEFEKVLREYCTRADAGSPLDPEIPLAALGVGSMEIVSLIVDLEDEFGTSLPEDMLTPETFATPGSLWAALASHLDLSGGQLEAGPASP